MWKQRRTLDITWLKRFHVRAQVDTVESHLMQSARDNIAELHNLHRCESAADRFNFIDSLPVENEYPIPVAECVEGGVRGPNPTWKESKAANKWPASTKLPGRRIPAVYLHQIVTLAESRW